MEGLHNADGNGHDLEYNFKDSDDPPVRDKEELLRLHDEAIEQGCIGDCFR